MLSYSEKIEGYERTMSSKNGEEYSFLMDGEITLESRNKNFSAMTRLKIKQEMKEWGLELRKEYKKKLSKLNLSKK